MFKRDEFARCGKSLLFKHSDIILKFAIFKAQKCVPYDQSKLFAHNAFKNIIQLKNSLHVFSLAMFVIRSTIRELFTYCIQKYENF